MANETALPVLPLAGQQHILLAVSGGSDSTALLHLAALQCRIRANPPQLTAVTVDHRLRSGSAVEARTVEAMCAALGVPHRTLVWEGTKPSAGIQDAARDARRNLIAAAAARAGADAVFTGHTLDDQMETVAMRQKRGPGPGLAGIAPASFVFNDAGSGEPVPFRRPLLAASRAALRAFLENRSASWIDDPSNDNDAFERVAIRRELAGPDGDRHAELSRIQKETALDRVESAARAAALIRTHAVAVAPGLIRLDHEFADARQTDALAALRILAAFSAGTPLPAESALAAQFLDGWRQARAGDKQHPARIGLGGALADIRREGLYLSQEQRRSVSSSLPFAGRYRLTGTEPRSRPPLRKADPVPSPASLIRKAASAEPVFDCPHAGATSCDEAYRNGRRLRLLVNPWPDLVPSFDLAAFNALADRACAPPIDSPLL